MQVEPDKEAQGEQLNEALRLSTLRKELREMRKLKSNRDCFTIIKEEKSKNPFMKNIAKSSEFSPSMGVVHRDRADNPNTPFVSGGPFRSGDDNHLSRKEFELRQSLSNLKSFGP